jgi:hypothetical protein
MSATTGRGKRPQNGSIPAQTSAPDESIEVLTISEAATFVRVAEEEVLRVANLQELPGRRIGGEWRFLKAGTTDWLRTPPAKPGKVALLALAGAWKDDPGIEEIVRQAHRRRGRLGKTACNGHAFLIPY